MSLNRYAPQYLTSQKGYLVVSFFVALSLWVVMLGKKDTTLVRNLKVVFVTENGLSVSKSSSQKVLAKLEGPRISILKLRSMNESMVIDVKNLSAGAHEVDVPINSLSLPVGVKLREVTPSKIWIKVESPITKEDFE